jgi:DNA-binding transcriptional LysR family regulator
VFTTTELQVLAALAEGHTLTQIGDEVELSHSTVSKVLRAAERKSKLRLLDREGRRLRLTNSGMELANSARAVIEELRSVDRTVEALQKGAAGTVRILTGANPAVSLMPRLIARFMALDTHATPIVRIDRGDVWTRFSREGYDLAVGRRKPPLANTVKTRWLFDDDLVLFVKKDPSRTQSPRWEDVLSRPLIGPFSSPLYATSLEQLKRLGYKGQSLEVESYATVHHLVELGAGVGMLSKLALIQELATERIELVEAPPLSGRVPYWLAIKEGARTDRLIHRLESLLMEDIAATFGEPAERQAQTEGAH